MTLFDDAATFQGVVGLCHHLQWAPLDVKLEVARRVMTFIFMRPDAPANVAKQVNQSTQYIFPSWVNFELERLSDLVLHPTQAAGRRGKAIM